ncbi:protein of unknown function (plasmid) [Pararobbsia alpina]
MPGGEMGESFPNRAEVFARPLSSSDARFHALYPGAILPEV